MLYRLSLLLIVCLALAPLAGRAEGDVAGDSYKNAKDLFAAGDQDYCMDGHYRAKPGDRWLAVAETAHGWALQDAVVSLKGKVEARSGHATWFFKNQNLPFGTGPVTAAKIKPVKTLNQTITAVTFDFGGRHWRWVEWGSADADPGMFYLSDGVHRWTTTATQNNGVQWIESAQVELPQPYRRPPASEDEGARDEYGDGVFQLQWAGDLNHDGVLDFIVYSAEKEAWGDALWLGEKLPGGLRFRQVLAAGDACD